MEKENTEVKYDGTGSFIGLCYSNDELVGFNDSYGYEDETYKDGSYNQPDDVVLYQEVSSEPADVWPNFNEVKKDK